MTSRNDHDRSYANRTTSYANPDFSKHPIYSTFWNDKIYTPMGPTDHLKKESMWTKVSRYALDSLDDACFAADIAAVVMLPFSVVPHIAAARNAAIGFSLAGKLVTSVGRKALPKIVDRTWSAVKGPFKALNKYEMRNLPKNPNELLKRGYKEISHPHAAKAGHRMFENPVTKQQIRFDHGKIGKPGHKGKDHYHYFNTNDTSRHNTFLDVNGNPCGIASEPSHIYPGN